MVNESYTRTHYKYVLLYVDDVLLISEKADNVLRKEIGQHFVLQEESIGPPSQYLGGKLREVTLENGNKAWAFGYLKRVIVTPAVYPRLVEFLHFDIQSTGQKSHCVNTVSGRRNALF